MKKDPNPRPHPRKTLPAGGLAEWMRTECIMDHGDEENGYTLRLARNGRSFTVCLRDGTTRTITVDGPVEIELIYPAVEGGVVICEMMRGGIRCFNVLTGLELTTEEIRRKNPQYYR